MRFRKLRVEKDRGLGVEMDIGSEQVLKVLKQNLDSWKGADPTPHYTRGATKGHFPCRHIVLNERGETIDSLYRQGTEEELELAVIEWLRNTIQALDSEMDSLPPTSTENRPPIESVAATV